MADVTDKDREAAVRLAKEALALGLSWRDLAVRLEQAIAQARAEGGVGALTDLRETLKGTLDWRDEHTNYGKAVRHTLQYVDAAISARGEKGKD